jgi:hypothetical protein
MVVLNSFKRLLPVGGPHNRQQLKTTPRCWSWSFRNPSPVVSCGYLSQAKVRSTTQRPRPYLMCRLMVTCCPEVVWGRPRTRVSPWALRWEMARAPSRCRPTLFAGRGSDGLAPRSRITPSIVDPVSAGEQRRRAREFADRVSRPSKARAKAVAPFMAAFLVHPPGLQFWPLMEWTSRMTARSSASAQ